MSQEKTIRPVAGKRYFRRDGLLTGPLSPSDCEGYQFREEEPFADGGRIYQVDGKHGSSHVSNDPAADLVAEHSGQSAIPSSTESAANLPAAVQAAALEIEEMIATTINPRALVREIIARHVEPIFRAVEADVHAALSTALSQGGGGEDGWISVKERMPEPHAVVSAWEPGMDRAIAAEWYDVTINGKPVRFWKQDHSECEADSGNYGNGASISARDLSVTHWRPLPPAPTQSNGV